MKLVFITKSMEFTGGLKIFFEYAHFLKKSGHDVIVLVQKESGRLEGTVEVEIVPDFLPVNIPECDLVIATTPHEVQIAWDSKKGDVVHFCQGFEIIDLEKRIRGQTIPNRFQKSSLLNSLKLFKKRLSWRKKVERIDKVYQLPTHLVTVTKPLKKILEERYKKDVSLCVYGIPEQFFCPRQEWAFQKFTKENPLRIVNVGPIDVTFKGIPTTIEAIQKAKDNGIPVRFIRITPKMIDEDHNQTAVDKTYEGLSPNEVGEVLRNCDVYISNSTDGEGFGLPAMEALCSGLVCVFSSISSYNNFSDRRDYCFFVPEYDSDSTFNAIKEIVELTEEKYYKLRKNSLAVSSGFSYEKACNRFEGILQNIVDKKVSKNR